MAGVVRRNSIDMAAVPWPLHDSDAANAGNRRSPADQPPGVDPEVMERLTAAAFGQRRKMLRSSLKGVPGAIEVAGQVGIDVQRRAETLSIAEFVALARALS